MFNCLLKPMEKRKDNTLTGCHAASRQEILFKNSNEDIDVKFSTKKQLSKMDFIQRGKFQNKK